MRKTILFCLTALFTVSALQAKPTKTKKSARLDIIFETDMGNDVDDAWALDMLYKYADKKLITLSAVMLNKPGDGPLRYVDLMNHWYGYPNIPIGRCVNEKNLNDGMKNYPQFVVDTKDEQGKPVFRRGIKDVKALPTAVELYRQMLSKKADHSVTIVSVGFSTNLAALLDSPADKYSPLSGKELVTKKVQRLVTMAGNMENSDYHEYNVWNDIPACQKVYAEWPTEIVTSPFELGKKALLPADCQEYCFPWTEYHPVLLGIKRALGNYRNYPTWDMTSVMYAVEGTAPGMTLSEAGTVVIDDKAGSHFASSPSGTHYYLKADEQQRHQLVKAMCALITTKPKKQRK